MMNDELIRIWQSASNEDRIKFKKSKLMIELQSSLGRLHRWWKYLELVEMVSLSICIISFTFITFWAPFITVKIASVLFIFFSIHILYKLVRIKKLKPSDFEAHYLEYLKKTRDYLNAQRGLLATAIYWVVLPIYPILLLFFAELWQLPKKRHLIVITFLLAIGMGVYGYFLNKKRVKKEMDPRIAKVDEMIEELERS